MTTQSLDRVFGNSRLKMVTGQYVEVYREAAAPGERRRYTKRFVRTREGDFRDWTEREWRILARLVGHGAKHVPDIVQYDRGSGDGTALVQTYDAGVTLDHWVTLLQVQRDGRRQRHIFQDCAHWWALAQHLLLALHEIHALRLVHLDLKADNICLPFSPPDFHPDTAQQRIVPVFEHIALIDFAFSLVSGEALTRPLPIGWQRAYAYQSPRLLDALVAGQGGDLKPTCQLDWRCDMYSLAALLKCYLPGREEVRAAGRLRGWTHARYGAAHELVLRIVESHDRNAGSQLPHAELAALCAARLRSADLNESLRLGWVLADLAANDEQTASTAPLTPVTLIEPPPVQPSVVTEIFVRREAIGTGGPTTVQPDAPGSHVAEPAIAAPGAFLAVDLCAASTLPAARVEAPSLSPEVEPSGRVGAEFSTSTTTAGHDPTPGLAIVEPPPLGYDPQPFHERPASGRLPDERPRLRRLRAARAATYGLPLLALIAASAWWLAGRQPLDEPEPPQAGAGTGAADLGRPTGAGGASGVVAARGAVAEPANATAASQVTTILPPRVVAAAAPPASVLRAARQPDASGSVVALPDQLSEPTLGDDGYGRRAREIVSQVLPTVVERAAPHIAQVLAAAARAQDAADDRRTREAAGSIGHGNTASPMGDSRAAGSSGQGRFFNAAANSEYWQHGNVARAYQLQWQAFGANPGDTEIAGNLAFYALKMNPPQIETSRRLAIYALTTARAAGRSRLEDWGNLAVASALSGRSDDAVNAMLVLMAVSRDPNRSCRSALSSVASFGPPLRKPAAALISRANARGSAVDAPYCRWPPNWAAGSKLP